jgi:SAM-dependent methyltransferase
MNRLHRWYCRSSHWKEKLDSDILPWALKGVDLGDEVLEVGPGPGLTTDWLSHRAKSVTCVEVDRALASSLRHRTAKTNITVLCGDATAMSLPDRVFSSAVCFTVLHHLSSPALQDRLFAEVYRVLRPSGVFAGTDSMQSPLMRIFHICDTMVLVDPAGLTPRLESAGFRDVKIEIGVGRFHFFARRPSESTPSNACEEYPHVGP